MKNQQTFSDIEYAGRKRVSRREVFLQKMDALIPRVELEAVIRPYYYTGNRGRPPRGIAMMLRMYLLQIWYNLSDEMAEESIYDSHAMKQFVRIDFQEEDVPDATTLLGFRHLLEGEGLQQRIFERINDALKREGMLWQGGSIVDASIIEAPSSTKNSANSRDSQMKQAKKGNEWHFGMKVHIGADAGTGMTHSVTFTGANEPDIQEAHKLVRADDTFVNADAGYIGIERREEIIKDEHLARIQWRVNERKGKARRLANALYKDAMNHLEWVGQPRWEEEMEYLKSKVRSKVEHTFYIIKHLFGYRKARYRGIAKNGARLYMLLAMANVLRWSWRLNSLGALAAAAG
jgi:IS5 family transposase